MLEKPALPDAEIAACLLDAYDLHVEQIEFLPIGYDVRSAVYRIIDRQGDVYFLKVRLGWFDDSGVLVSRWLHDHGLNGIIPPLPTLDGKLWAQANTNTYILCPFVEGKDGYTTSISDEHWHDFGRYLRRLHDADLPEALRVRIPREQFVDTNRQRVHDILKQVVGAAFSDAIAAKLAAFISANAHTIHQMVERARHLAGALKSNGAPFVLCHGDMHPGNLHIAGDGALFLVDWDNLIYAPAELDLIFSGNDSRASALFQQGYGGRSPDITTLAYYRYERILSDIAAFCEQIFSTQHNGADGEMAYHYCSGMFAPGEDVERADQTYNAICP